MTIQTLCSDCGSTTTTTLTTTTVPAWLAPFTGAAA